MANLSRTKRDQIKQLIKDHYKALAVEVLGIDAVSAEDYARIGREGILDHAVVDHAQVSVQAAHAVGKLHASDAKLARMKPDAFWRFVETAPPQFHDVDLDAVMAARDLVGHAITNLGTEMVDEFDTGANEADVRARHTTALRTVQHEIGLGIARDQTNAQIIRRLKRKVQDSERNWALVVTTELHNAQDHGTAITIARADGADALCFKRTQPTACRYCKLLYNLPNGRPRIFKLSTLVNNGTNVGKKAGRPNKTEWKAVIGATHPACQCELTRIPKGYTLDNDGTLVTSLRKAIPDDLPARIAALINHRCEA